MISRYHNLGDRIMAIKELHSFLPGDTQKNPFCDTLTEIQIEYINLANEALWQLLLHNKDLLDSLNRRILELALHFIDVMAYYIQQNETNETKRTKQTKRAKRTFHEN